MVADDSEVFETVVLDVAHDIESACEQTLQTECQSSGRRNGTHALQPVACAQQKQGSAPHALQPVACGVGA